MLCLDYIQEYLTYLSTDLDQHQANYITIVNYAAKKSYFDNDLWIWQVGQLLQNLNWLIRLIYNFNCQPQTAIKLYNTIQGPTL
jgi:hypothetical protein